MSKNGAYPSKHVHLCEIFHKQEHLLLEKVIPVAKFANHYKKCSPKETAYKGGYMVAWFLYPDMPTVKY